MPGHLDTVEMYNGVYYNVNTTIEVYVRGIGSCSKSIKLHSSQKACTHEFVSNIY